MYRFRTVYNDKIFFGVLAVIFAILALSLNSPKPAAADCKIPPTMLEKQVGNADAKSANPAAPPYTQKDPSMPGKCIGGDKSCNPLCGVSNSKLGPCYSQCGSCQPPPGLQSCDSLEKQNPKGDEGMKKDDGKKEGEGKGGEPPKMPEIPKGEPKQDQKKDDQQCPSGQSGTPPNCQEKSAVSSFLDSINPFKEEEVFNNGNGSTEPQTVVQQIQNGLEKMASFVSGGSGQGSLSGGSGNDNLGGSGAGSNLTNGLGSGASRESGNTSAGSGSGNNAAGSGNSAGGNSGGTPVAQNTFGSPTGGSADTGSGNSGSGAGSTFAALGESLRTQMSSLFSYLFGTRY